MQLIKGVQSYLNRRALAMVGLVFLAGCAGSLKPQQQQPNEEYVEIENPAVTMSPSAPATIWVPRSYVDKGAPRGGELAKRSYNAVMGSAAQAQQMGSAAPAPQTGSAVPAPHITAHPAAVPSGVVGTGGKAAHFIPSFGLIAAVEGDKVFFNLGRETGVAQGQKLKVYRGGTVVEGLGLAPGEYIATVEVVGFVGTKGGYGIVKQGGPVQTNDLIGAE
jgi:hypothetical protein